MKSPSLGELLRNIVLPLAVVFLIEPLYRDYLYDLSLKLTPELQKQESLKSIMKVISGMGSGQFYGFVLVFIFNTVAKPAALYMICACSFANYALNELKSFYGEPRPYWVSDEVVSTKCLASFGNPSGHMTNHSFLWFTIYLHAFYDIVIDGEPQH